MGEATRTRSSAANVRLVYIFLCGVTCALLGLVGSGLWLGKHAHGCLEKAVHSGGRCRFSNDESAGVDIHARLDAPTGRALAASTPSDLFNWCVGDLALLVAQGGQERFADGHDLRRRTCRLVVMASGSLAPAAIARALKALSQKSVALASVRPFVHPACL